jgi:hypothetical protein
VARDEEKEMIELLVIILVLFGVIGAVEFINRLREPR